MTTRRKYPSDWAEIARAIKEASGWTCEVCGLRFGTNNLALPDQPRAQCADGRLKKFSVHHIDDDTTNNTPTNLLPCCQECHLTVEVWKPGMGIPAHWSYEFWAWIRSRNLPYIYNTTREMFSRV